MPWKLVPPREGKTLFYYIRGKYLGIRLDHSTGTSEARAARRILATWRQRAERGKFKLGEPKPDRGDPAFANAAVAYMRAGGDGQYLEPILRAWPHKLLADIDQIAIDTLAAELYPNATAATRNRQVYTPISAVLKRAGRKEGITRPIGWRGRRSTRWLEPQQAFAIFAAADKLDAEFGLFLRTLCYTGMRLSECLGIRLADLNLDQRTIYLPETKNDEARSVYLPGNLVVALANHPRGLDRHPTQRLFRFHASGRLRTMLNMAKAAAGVVLPRRQGGFHVFCHTYGTWMRRYGQLDTFDLLDTGRWKDPASANRYAHTEPGEMARRADLLPTEAATQIRGVAVEKKSEAT
jgi:integrase